MAKWLAVIMMIAPISGFTWTVLNWKPFLNQRPGTVLSAKSGVEANIPEFNVLTRFINNVYSNGTTESQIFTRAQQIVTILSNVVTSPFLTVTKSMGWVAPKMLYLFRMFPITRSTCILTLAILRVCSTSIPLSCFLPLVNAGILIVEQNNPTDSWMSKPLSAKMTSPGVRWSSRPLFSVRCLSLTLPPHPSEIKLTVPWGVIPIRYLTVLWCLYEENVWALASRFKGRSRKI